MLTISPERVTDIHALNEEFLSLVVKGESGEAFGLNPEIFQELKSMSLEMLKRIATTDLLLFTIIDGADGDRVEVNPQDLPHLLERVQIVARDFARVDTGLAVSYLGISKEKCGELLKMGMMQIVETSKSGRLRIIPLGTSAFRMLGKLASSNERTQYVALAAND